jgi:NADH-quinone oxidoreductase subunit A
MMPTAIVAYLTLFATVGFLFVLASLLLGRLFRAHAPTPQKNETYECGEPAIGSSSVQFDLRFYVVALLFLIFEVEVAMFFPPAVIFGKATHLRANPSAVSCQAVSPRNQVDAKTSPEVVTTCSADTLALGAMLDLGLFFVVLLVGFAYVWRCGDLDWVRAVRHPQTAVRSVAWESEDRP